MNSFHLLGVRGGHPVLMSSLQTDQQNGQFADGSPSYLFSLSQEIEQRNKIIKAKIYLHAIMCLHLYPSIVNPMKCGYFYCLFQQMEVQQGKVTCPRSQSYVSNRIGIWNRVSLRAHTLHCHGKFSASQRLKVQWSEVMPQAPTFKLWQPNTQPPPP